MVDRLHACRTWAGNSGGYQTQSVVISDILLAPTSATIKRADNIYSGLTVYAEMINGPFGMVDGFYCSRTTALRLRLSLWLTASGQ